MWTRRIERPGGVSISSSRALALIVVLALAAGVLVPPTFASADPQTSAPSVRQAYTAITQAAGLGGFLHAGFVGNFTDPGGFAETMGPGACWIDIDGDGWLDLFLVNGRYHTDQAKELALQPTSHLYRNLAGAGFEDVSITWGAALRMFGQGCAVADYDNDGDADLFVAGYGNDVMLRNDGTTFTNATAELGLGASDCAPWPCWSASGTWLDADRDGCLDLYVTRFGNSTLDSEIPHGPDGAPQQRDQFYRGACGGPFLDATESAGFHTWGNGWSAVAYDVNDDAWSDLYVSNDGDANELWINDGDGTFTLSPEAADPRSGMGTAVGDLDMDGLPDIVTTNFVNEDNGVWLQRANGSYEDIGDTFPFVQGRPYSGWATVISDIDHDGLADLTVVNSMPNFVGVIPTEQPIHIFHQLPGGAFEQWNATLGDATSGRYIGRGAAFADHDNDGDVDMLLAEGDERPTNLWRMDRPPGRSLTLSLEGNAPGVTRDAEGAKITVSTGVTPTYSKEKRAQQGYLSSNDPRVHFGLGQANDANVTIRWPDGSEQSFASVPANSFVRVVQGGPLQIIKRLPLATADGPAEMVRLQPGTLTARLDVDVTRATWDFGDGGWAVCADAICRDETNAVVGSIAGRVVTVDHAYTTVGVYDARVALTDASGHETAARVAGEVTARVIPTLAFDAETFDIHERARGTVRVVYEDGVPIAGAAVRLDVTFSFWPLVENALLPTVPAGARTLAGYRTVTLEGSTDATGEWRFELPLWWQSPIPAGRPAEFNPVGDYAGALSGSYRGNALDSVNAAYRVMPDST